MHSEHQHLSRLETIPIDVLQRIAFFAASFSCACSSNNPSADATTRCSCTLQAPAALSSLLRTSSSIHSRLSLTAAPALYADLFFAAFDTQALTRRYQRCARRSQVCLTSSALAAEFVNRCRLLRRVRHGDISSHELIQSLWTALWMLLESDGANEIHLAAAGFSDFILRITRSYMNPGHVSQSDAPSIDSHHVLDFYSALNAHELNSVIIWVLCLSVHKDVILGMSKYDREALVACIFPYMFGKDKASVKTPSLRLLAEQDRLQSAAFDAIAHHLTPSAAPVHDWHSLVTVYAVSSAPIVPDPSGAAIQLIFALQEPTINLEMPPHLPDTRAQANQAFRGGPTKEDFRVFASYRTPLHSDTLLRDSEGPYVASHGENRRSTRHDGQFHDTLDILRHSQGPAMQTPASSQSAPFQYIPGSLTGLWEGTQKNFVKINELVAEAGQKPLEMHLGEFICPVTQGSTSFEDAVDLWGALPSELFEPKEDCTSVCIGGQEYTRFTPTLNASPLNDATHYNTILLGETPENYSLAWGKSYFFGKVNADGTIILRLHMKTVGGNYVLRGQVQSEISMTGRITMGLPTQGPDIAAHSAFSLRRAIQGIE